MQGRWLHTMSDHCKACSKGGSNCSPRERLPNTLDITRPRDPNSELGTSLKLLRYATRLHGIKCITEGIGLAMSARH